jgi:hypothetical protein
MSVEPEKKPVPSEETPKPEAKPEAPKPEAAPKVEAKPPAKSETSVADTKSKTSHKLDDDEEIPENADLLELSSKALTRRLQRFRSKELKEHFGTDDIAKIKADLAEGVTLKKEKEEARRAKLDSEAKMKEDLDAANARVVKAETKAQAVRQERVIDKEDGRILKIAEKFIKPKFWKHIAQDLKDHLRENYSADEMAKLKEKDFDRWFKSYLGENPEFAKDGAQTTPKVPLNATTTDNTREMPNETTNGGKTIKPGQPNSMTPAEARQAAGKSGYHW